MKTPCSSQGVSIPPEQTTLRKLVRDILDSEFGRAKGSRDSLAVECKPLWWPQSLCYEQKGELLSSQKGVRFTASEIREVLRGIFVHYRRTDRDRFDSYLKIIDKYKPVDFGVACCARHRRATGYTVWSEEITLGTPSHTLVSIDVAKVCVYIDIGLVH